MQLQYKQIKKDYPDHILFFRLGDFYEVFDEDAVIASKVLGITLTGRGKDEKRRPMAGIPHHALSNYLGKLVEHGLRVVIADQTEAATPGKLVQRKVTKVITPGTLLDPKNLDSDKNNYIGFLDIRISKKHETSYYFAFCELTTGEFKILQTNNALVIKNEIEKISPAEVVCGKGKMKFTELVYKGFLNETDINETNLDQAEEIIKSQTGVFSIESLGLTKTDIIISAAMLLKYLQSCQRDGFQHIKRISIHNSSDYMKLDFSTIRNLELLQTSSSVSEEFTLFGILNECITSMGTRQLRNWIVNPLIDQSKLKNRLEIVNYFFSNPILIDEARIILKTIADLERIVGRIGTSSTNPKEILSLSESLENSLRLLGLINNQENVPENLIKANSSIKSNFINEVITLIRNTIYLEAPLNISDGNVIADGFSAEIDELRSIKNNSKNILAEIQTREIKRTGITSLKISFNKVFGYYIEITNANKDKVPSDYIRKQTLANNERFITQELKELEEKILNSEEQLFKLENQLFRDLITKLYDKLDSISQLANVISDTDIFINFAKLARLRNYSKPQIIDSEEDIIIESRHPVVELNVEKFTPNPINFSESEKIHIITGPNMSGKSTYIKQVAICYLMAQIGSFVPAKKMQFEIIDNIFTRAGASDNLSRGESTFMVEMIEAANILNNATKNSLVILDEIGRGTSTYDGVSIAWSIIEYIQSRINCKTLFATHYHELTKLEGILKGVVNYNVEVDEKNGQIRFMHSIQKGFASKSYGVHVAQIAGLPQEVTKRAENILNAFEKSENIEVKNGNNKTKNKEPNPRRPKMISPDQLELI